jgi:hypothetical protein
MRVPGVKIEGLAAGLGELAVGCLLAALLTLFPQVFEAHRCSIDDIGQGSPKGTIMIVEAGIFPAEEADPPRPLRSELAVEEPKAGQHLIVLALKLGRPVFGLGGPDADNEEETITALAALRFSYEPIGFALAPVGL